MAITRGQASGLAVVGSGTSLAVTWGVNPSAGNTILVFVQCANAPSSVVDNGTTPSTFTLDKSTAGGQGAYIYRANNITLPGAGSYSVTVTTSTLTTIGGAGIEYAGVASGPPTATNSSSGTGTSAATGSAAPAGSGGLVFGGFSDTSGLNPETITFTGPSPQAEQFRETNGASFWPWAVADALTGSAQNFTWTLGDSVAAGGVAAAYDATGTGGGGGTNPTWDPAGSYTMVFDDEFTGTTLDTSKWQPGWFAASGITPPVNAGGLQNNSANVSVSGGTLNMLLTSSFSALVTSNPANSGTAVGFQQTYPAAFEARINIPGNTGGAFNWPTWWTDGQNWPATGEIDFVEGLSGGTTSYHVHDAAFPGGLGGDATPPYTGWHTFGAMWTATQVKFYYDGALVGTVATDGFTGPLYLVLENKSATTSPSPVPTTMQVDWVRVWTPGGGAAAGAAAGAGAVTAKAVQRVTGVAAGAGAVAASARQTTASAAGAGAVTAKAVQRVTGVAAGAGAVAASATSSVFPGPGGGNPLGVKVELLLAGSWTDITRYARLRNPVQISGMGRSDWTSTLQAATLTLTLANDGRFTPKLTAGAYYPNITRNTQIRVSVNATSVTGVAYSGFRFWGEVAEWPPHWSVSARDVYVDITANGIWRRMSQLATTLGSAFTRYNSLTLTGTSAPRAYWPCEDGTGSGQLVSYDSVAGTANAVQSFVTGQPGLSLAACTDFKGSDGIPQLNGASITATVPAGGTATNNVTRWLLSVPKAGDSAQGSTAGNLIEIDSAGTVAKFEVYLNPAPGTLLMQLRNSAGTLIASGTTTTSVKGQPYLVSCELTPSGSNVAFALRIIKPGGAGITESLIGSVPGSVGAISAVKFSRANVLMDTAVGHLSVTYGAVPLMVPAAYALGGYAGEFALDRFSRICGEMGITAETIGTAATSAAMGPQLDDTLTNVLQSIEDVDMGLLFESRTQFGLGYRTLTSMANQAAAATISYTANRVDPSLAPVYDDSLTRNNVTVTNQSSGYTQQSILTAGPMSVLNPPSGIGNGYAYQRTVNAASDTQAGPIATWLLNVGSVDEVRFPVVTMKMIRAENAGLFAVIPGLRPGDYIQITSPPSFLTASTIKQLTFGYSETLGQHEWTFAYNTVPESPYETGFSAGTVQTAQLPGSGAVTSTAPGAGGLGGIIQNGSITPSMLNAGITVKTLGGNRITISASAPANPDTGDIWIASGTGLISQWDGAVWQPFKFDASSTIQAGTIVAANIASSTLTSSLIAAGQVYAGFVDATNIFANTYVATSAAGQFLAYDVSTPTVAHLINALAGAAGTDSVGNAYPKGLLSQQLTLPSQGSAPPSFAGASVLYTSSGGRLRYLSTSGADLVLDRSALNLSNVSMTTSATPVILSGALNYLANEAIVGSEYEIEIDGTITTPTSTPQQFTFSLFSDGAIIGTDVGLTIGTVILQASQTFSYTLRYRATIEATGAGGTCTCACDGAATRRLAIGTGVGNAQQFTTLNKANVAVPFDTTSNHTLAIYANWGVAPGSGSAVTLRTKIVRRN